MLPEIFNTYGVQRGAATLVGAATREIVNRVEKVGLTTPTGQANPLLTL